MQDGTAKMSKSAELDISRINLLDDPKTITNKVKKAKTDAFEGLELDNPERPESRNLLTIYQLMTGYSKVLCLTYLSNVNKPYKVFLIAGSGTEQEDLCFG